MLPQNITATDATDETITRMINSLVEVMYVPINITDVPRTKDVGTQAGLTCMKCGYHFFSNSSLHRHMNSHHSTILLRCQMCSATFNKMESMLHHMEHTHVIRTSNIQK